MVFLKIDDLKWYDTVLRVYEAAKKEEGCPWDEHYPSAELLKDDIETGNMYGFIDMGKIAGLVVRDRDEEIDKLPCWDRELKPAAELARLVVSADYQNRGIARRLIEEMCTVLRQQGFKSVHYLVALDNIRAVRSYCKLEFKKKGELFLFSNEYACYEKDLINVEMWDAYDENFQLIPGMTLIRGESIPDDVYHIVSEVLVKHRDGTYLCMQRDFGKNKGGKWELSAGGSAKKGENSLQAAKRELKEETGLDEKDFLIIGKDKRKSTNTLFVKYMCVTDCDKASIVLQEGETVGYRWLSAKEIFDMPVDAFASTRVFDHIL